MAGTIRTLSSRTCRTALRALAPSTSTASSTRRVVSTNRPASIQLRLSTMPYGPHVSPAPPLSSPASSVRCRSSGVEVTPAVSAEPSTSKSTPTWQARMLYDGDCPLCMREVNFLREKDAGRGIVDFVDISSPSYDPADNAGISYEEGMRGLHCITADGQVLENVPAFRRLYEVLGMGWVYAITTVQPIGKWIDGVYGFWAKYRMQVTGRDALEILLERRRTGGATCATLEEGACEIPSKQDKST